jgi:hypothetical protein
VPSACPRSESLVSTSGGGRPLISKHDVGWSIVTRVNPKTVTVALDWNVGTRSYAVADAEV